MWYDLDADGVQDTGEPGLAGGDVTVTWLGGDGIVGGDDDVVLPIQTTDASGLWGIAGIPAGQYVAEVTAGVPAGLSATFDEDGTADGVADPVAVASGETHDTTDFGYAGTGSISSPLWLDLDGDGVLDPGEPGIPSVDVTVVWAGPDGVLGTGDDVPFTVTTEPDGVFTVPNLPAGDISITVDAGDLPAGVTSTFDLDGGADGAAVITLTAGQDFTDPAFGYAGTASLDGSVWYDVNSDSIADPDEPGVAGAAIAVTHHGLDGLLGTGDDMVISVVADSSGNYSIPGLPDGGFTAVLDTGSLPAGTAAGSDTDGGDPTVTTGTLTGPTEADASYGVIGTGTATGALFDDVDGDGVLDAGEGAGPAGVTISITWQGPDGPVSVTVTSAADGTFSIPNLPPGDYTIAVDESTLPPGVALTTPATVDVSLTPGGSLDVLFGTVALVDVMGVLFIDADGDGTPDLGEGRLSGVTVELYDDLGNLVDTMVSGADGSYSFSDLLPGEYRVVVLGSTLPPDVEPLPDGVTCTLNVDGNLSCLIIISGNSPVALLDLAFAFVPSLPFTGIDGWLLLMAAMFSLVAGMSLLVLARRSRESGLTR